ncbi:integrase arm-type DNA-binding domain-containing protein [Agrobacterium fabrum]|uniref:tyrosine-type recombinase/integrase n=1 Tax=Agrobacterium fabrum TaxID=1176649 RepID=UPI000EF632A8|nr:site-specific integrase [Agrobacterium fabrum]AYM62914.1 phage-related integrase [Agrobacterium fabrum]NTE61012.1 integrase arm-type DNA-binding domain-containing protein [Agrobacterium fabrum]
MRFPPKKLTDAGVSSLKTPPKGRLDEHPDAMFPGFAVRVSDRGRKTFILITRYPGSSSPTRRAIGHYPVMSLAEAREEAKNWTLLIARGVDPKEERIEAKKESARKRVNNFAAVVEDYLKDILTRQRNRHAKKDATEIRRELLDPSRNAWMKKSISDITDADIAELIGAIRDRPAPGMAYNVWGHIKAIFSWAMWPERRQGYGLTSNPTQHLQPKHFKLSKTVSTRVLSDDEIRAYWQVADETPYPLGPFYKLLMLTGQRKSEVSDAAWGEFDLIKRKLWTVPEERFKSGQSHLVPLSIDALSLLSNLERFVGEGSGDFLFSTTKGAKPINGFSRAKSALDKAMLKKLKKNDPNAKLPDWVFHDVRRTVRTRLSSLRVNSDVAEMVIGHGKTGLRRVYDQHEFEQEMREALDRWALALKAIVRPPVDHSNVVDLKAS